MDMNTDVQLIILEKLDVSDLASFGQTNHHISMLATDVFKRRYSKKIIEIVDPKLIAKNVLDGNEVIYLSSYDTISPIFKQFGTSISKLRIVYSSCGNDSDINLINSINDLITSKCSQNLVQMEIASYFESFFDGMTRPFERVKNLTIDGHFNKLGNAHLSLVDLFPAVKRLTLPYIKTVDKSGIDHKFPRLEHLHVSIFNADDPLRLTEADVENLLRKNPQIRSLILGCTSQTFLKTVNDLLPNLENLVLELFITFRNSDNAGTINFKNVKIFTMSSAFHTGPNYIHFDNLEELHTDAFPGSGNWGIEFAKKTKSLQRLYIDRGCVGCTELDMLASANLHLTEISMELCLSVDKEKIVNFVRSNPQMKIFRFSTSVQSILQSIQQQLEHDWKITEMKSLDGGIARFTLSIESNH